MHFLWIPPGPRYPLRKVFFRIGLSCLLVIGGYFSSISFMRYLDEKHRQSSLYSIRKLVQTGPQYEALPTPFFAERLHLSLDHPENLYSFDLAKAKEALLGTHIIRDVECKRLKPDSLYIEYRLRKPRVFVGDFSNTLIDEEGVLFPYQPFFRPNALPEVVFGKQAFTLRETFWGGSVDEDKLHLLDRLLQELTPWAVVRIDLSHCEAESLGQRQIVVELEGEKVLRLSTANFSKELCRYQALERVLLHSEEGSCIIDLRIPEVAFVEKK